MSQDLPAKPKATDIRLLGEVINTLHTSTVEHTAEGEAVIYKILTSKV